MHVNSDASHLERYLHQLAESETDLNDFRTEAQTYLADVPLATRVRWNREFIKKMMNLMSPGSFISDWVLTPTGP